MSPAVPVPIFSHVMNSSMIASRTCALKVNLNCRACERKVYKQIKNITGVKSIAIDVEQGIVTVCGVMEPSVVQKALAKIKKRAEILWDSMASKNINGDDSCQDFGGKPPVHHQLCGGFGCGASGITGQSCNCHSHNGYTSGGKGWGPGCASPPLMPPQPYFEPSIFSDENPNCCTLM